jgi:hypothetical protein
MACIGDIPSTSTESRVRLVVWHVDPATARRVTVTGEMHKHRPRTLMRMGLRLCTLLDAYAPIPNQIGIL